MGLGLMGVLASVLGGVLIEGVGVGPVYYLSALLYLVTIAAYLRLPLGRRQRGSLSYRGIGRDIGEGLDYIRRNAHLKVLLSARLARALLALPYRTFLPVFAADILGVGATELGVLSAAPRFGAMAASLVVAYLGDLKRKGQYFLAAGMAIGVGLVLFASAPWFYLAILFLLCVGVAENVTMIVGRTLLQTTADRRMRGRVMSVSAMLWGLSPLGTLPAGAVADVMSAAFAVGVLGALLALFFLTTLVTQPEFRDLR
jgi:MFS family permease